ncbi:MAG: hypothetical protein A2X40_00830 [Elusimicrobia bacterium GWC2_65_9]|nr:MAG: hypothetical protein A2X40_00830 [Elusimicrobia bacterium GWC2_65_9]
MKLAQSRVSLRAAGVLRQRRTQFALGSDQPPAPAEKLGALQREIPAGRAAGEQDVVEFQGLPMPARPSQGARARDPRRSKRRIDLKSRFGLGDGPVVLMVPGEHFGEFRHRRKSLGSGRLSRERSAVELDRFAIAPRPRQPPRRIDRLRARDGGRGDVPRRQERRDAETGAA